MAGDDIANRMSLQMNFSRSASAAAMPRDKRRMAATAEEGTARKPGSRKCGERTKPIAGTSAVRRHAGKTAKYAVATSRPQDTNRITGSNVRLGTEMPVGLWIRIYATVTSGTPDLMREINPQAHWVAFMKPNDRITDAGPVTQATTDADSRRSRA